MTPASARDRRWVASLLSLVVVGSLCVGAQVRVVRRGDDRLRGIHSVDVLAVDATSEGSPCRVGRDGLRDAAVEALKATGLRATASGRASSWFHTVEIEVRSILSGDQCVSVVSAELVADVDGLPDADRGLPPEAWGSLLIGDMRLARESTIIAVPVDRQADRVVDELRTHVAAIGERIGRVNRQ